MWRIMADSAGFIDKTGHRRCGPLQTPISVPMWWPQSISQKESHSPAPEVRAVKMCCPHISTDRCRLHTDDRGFPAKPQMLIGTVFLILCVSDNTEYLNTPASSTWCELPASPEKSLNPSFITSLPNQAWGGQSSGLQAKLFLSSSERLKQQSAVVRDLHTVSFLEQWHSQSLRQTKALGGQRVSLFCLADLCLFDIGSHYLVQAGP